MQKQHTMPQPEGKRVPSKGCVVGFFALFSGGWHCFLWVGPYAGYLGGGAGVVGLHVGHLGGGLGKSVFMLDPTQGGLG